MSECLLSFDRVALPGLADGGLSLEVPPHAAAVIQGPEASGVDLLIRYALGLTRPTAGHVLLIGQDVTQLSRTAALAFRRQVGYLPAGDGLLQNLSLKDNVALPLRFGSKMSEREIASRLGIMLTQFRLSDAAHLRPAAVTDELRRRTALARALAFDPSLVMMEDPFDGLTTRASAELLAIARGGETDEGARRTVFITGQQVPYELENRIEWRYRLRGGRLMQEN